MENKEKQKNLIIEIMKEDEKDDLYKNKQTVVDILIEAIYKRFGIANCEDMFKDFEKAKELEKQQIIKAYEEGDLDSYPTGSLFSGEEYYNKTYGK